MGSFSHNCKLSGLPITSGDPVVLIVMKPVSNLYDCSEERLKEFGKTYLCSNDGPRLKFVPCWFPIKGDYDDYGGIENIIEDDNTRLLEQYYDLKIQEICDIITSGRKDDGYDDSLSLIKKTFVLPDDYIDGEDHFDRYMRLTGDNMPFGKGVYPDSSFGGDNPLAIYRDGKKIHATKEEYDADFKLIHEQYARYNEWTEKNPDLTDDYGKPQYQERYKELISYSGMWVHGALYDSITETPNIDRFGDKLDLGEPELLKALGFIEGEIDKTKERYNRPFTKGNLTIYSDGTWIHISSKKSIYYLDEFSKYCAEQGEPIDVIEMVKKDRVEQTFDYILPTVNIEPGTPVEILSEEDLKKSYDDFILNVKGFGSFKFSFDTFKRLRDRKSTSRLVNGDRMILHYFMNTDMHSDEIISNPITELYINSAKEGKLRDNVVRFWRFDGFMWSLGRFYDIVGTSPQDGDHKNVLKVLEASVKILKDTIVEYGGDEEDE